MPQYLIRQAIAHIQQSRNLDQLTQARYSQMFANANRGENSQPYEDVSVFLPHPFQWKMQSEDRKVQVSRKCAIEFLQTYKKFDVDVEVAFDDWLYDIQMCAQF